jgi:starvation-inducible outer membrane lipoprotein
VNDVCLSVVSVKQTVSKFEQSWCDMTRLGFGIVVKDRKNQSNETLIEMLIAQLGRYICNQPTNQSIN